MVERYVIAIENILQKMKKAVVSREKRILDEWNDCLKNIGKQRREIIELKNELKKLKNRVDK